MRFTKPALTFEQQADLLLSRGMSGDREVMRERLATVNYYRLAGYWHPYRLKDSDHLRAGTTFADVWARYAFDRNLRLHVLNAIERIEVAARTQLSYHHANAGGPFAYATNRAAFPSLRDTEPMMAMISAEVAKSREVFVEHFKNKYGADHDHLPIWVVSEVLSFGIVVRMIRHSPNAIRTKIANVFGVAPPVLDSWLLTINTVRNICAHHGRLWNRTLGTQPKIPDAWRGAGRQLDSKKLYPVLAISNHCLGRISPGSNWASRLVAMLEEHRRIPLGAMGFPAAWSSDPIWANALLA